MKYIIAGLGTFGSSLAQKLTAMGHEVIGIDSNMDRVDSYKEKISHTIQMDATDELTVAGLPLANTDIVIIAIGEDQGANILATATFKNLQVKRLISRAVNPLHEKVLKAIGVDEIVHPEEETADRWSKKLSLKHVIDSYELGDSFSIIESKVPEQYINKTVDEVDARRKYNIIILSVIKSKSAEELFSPNQLTSQASEIARPDQLLEQYDKLVLYGSNTKLAKFLDQSA